MTPASGASRPEDAKAGGRVLVVEDDPLLSRSIARTLRANGAIVTQASDGLLAEQMLRVRRFDLVLTDLSLPDMSGIEIVARARALDPDVSIVFMTGTPTADSAARAVELGALRYLMKPVEPQLLLSTVSEATQHARDRRVSTGALPPVASEARALEDRFTGALSSLWMAYQPICGPDGVRYGHEALLRSDEPSLANALALLDAADTLQRVHDLGRRIRLVIAGQMSAAPASPAVFVNLHPLDLLDDELYTQGAPLGEHARRVVLELSDRRALDTIPDAHVRIARLRGLGFRCAVEELGAGHAGGTSLAMLRPEVVKIDMSLVRDVDRDAGKQKTVASAVTVAHGLGALVVATGIETEAERACVLELGCDLLQGYALGRPARLTVL